MGDLSIEKIAKLARIELNEVEIKIRKSAEVLKINTDAAVDKLKELIKVCRKNNKEVS